MKRAVLVNRDDTQFTPLEEICRNKEMEVLKAGSAKELLDLLDTTADRPVNLIILSSRLEDMAPKPLVEAVTQKSPFSHCVVAGEMEDKEFHDYYEGLGVLMQVAETPGAEDARNLSGRLDKLAELGIF